MTPPTASDDIGQIISRHNHPRPLLRRANSRLTAFGLFIVVVAALGQIVAAVALWPVGMLFIGTALITLIFIVPLLLQSILHPQIALTDRGLRIRPMLWKRQFVPRESILRMVEHPLIQNNETLGRILFGKNYRPRRGQVILVRADAGLPPIYRFVGLISASGLTHGFAISTTSHTDYDALHAAISAWLDG